MASIVESSRTMDCPFEVALVASNKPDAPGLDFARAQGIATWSHLSKGMDRAGFDRMIDAALREAHVDAVALAGYMRILSPEFIAKWKGRILNIHPSLLPLYKGLDTHARALVAGEGEAGCSVHIVTEGLDDGPVVDQARVPILPGDTPDLLAARVLIEEHRLYPAAIARYVREQL